MSLGTQVFISCAKMDCAWLDRIELHLQPLVQRELVVTWDERCIQPGSNWREKLAQALARAHIAVLLISSSFLASEFLVDQVLGPLLEAAEKGQVKLLPIIVSHCLFEIIPGLSKYSPVNPLRYPLNALSHSDQEKYLTELSRSILESVKQTVLLPGEDVHGSDYDDAEKIELLLKSIETKIDSTRCFVREPELSRLSNQVEYGNNMAIVGDVGSGKTTIIHRLLQKIGPLGYICGYLDLAQSPNLQYESEFWQAVAMALSLTGDSINFYSFRDLLKTEKKYLLCLDNVDVLMRRPLFDFRILLALRGILASSRQIVSVVSSKKHLQIITENPILGSPWFNIFQTLDIDNISEKRARDLLKSAGIDRTNIIEFCLITAKRYLPIDLLILAYLTRDYKKITSDMKSGIEDTYKSILKGFR